MDILQFRLHGWRFMLTGSILNPGHLLDALPMDPGTPEAIYQLAQERAEDWKQAVNSGQAKTREEQRAVLERP